MTRNIHRGMGALAVALVLTLTNQAHGQKVYTDRDQFLSENVVTHFEDFNSYPHMTPLQWRLTNVGYFIHSQSSLYVWNGRTYLEASPYWGEEYPASHSEIIPIENALAVGFDTIGGWFDWSSMKALFSNGTEREYFGWNGFQNIDFFGIQAPAGARITAILYLPEPSYPSSVSVDNVRVAAIVQRQIAGSVTLQDWGGATAGTPIEIQIREVGGAAALQTATVTLDASGGYSLAATVPPGTYDVLAKGSKWLRQLRGSVVLTSSGAAGVDFSLVNGDVDGDNAVTVFDYNALSEAFDSAEGDPNWKPDADLDGDGTVSVYDYNILSQNFDQVGDE